jgi:VanZ family protein
MLAWLPVIAWAAAIFLASAQSDLRFAPDAGLDFVVRKLGHMTVFGILALLAWRALARTTDLRPAAAWAAAFSIAYAITDELHQGFVASRHPAVTDVAIDAAGVLIALMALAATRRVRRRRDERTLDAPRA